MSIAKLTVDLLAESSKFRSELDKAQKSAKDWAGSVRESANEAANHIAAMGAAAATALAAMYTATAQNIDEQAKFADRIGISTEALAGLQYAGQLTGVATDRMADSLQGMVERISEATTGTGEAAEALENLGLSAQTLNQLSPEKQFLEIARAMGEVENRSDQVRMAIQIFEGEGAALLNTLDAGADGINAMMTEAETLGIALSRIDAAKVEAANDAFYRSSQTAKGFAQSLTVELAPIVEGISKELVRAANEAGGFGEVASDVVDKLSAGFGVLADSIRGWEFIFAGLGQLWKEMVYAVVHDITYLDQVMTDLVNKLPGMNAEYNQTLQTMTRELSSEMLAGRDELHNLLMQPLPSESIDQYVHKWRELSEVQAQAVANSKEIKTGDLEPPAIIADEDTLAKELAKLQESLMAKEALIIQQTQKELEILRQAKEAEYITQLEYDALSKELMNQRFSEAALVSDNFWMNFAAQVEKSTTDFDTMWGNTFNSFTSSFGNAVADAIVDGENFGDMMAQVAKGFAKSMISAAVEIAAKQATLWIMEKTLMKTQQAGFVAKVTGEAQAGAALAAINSYASAAAIPVTGWAMAPAVAANAMAVNQAFAALATTAAAGSLAGMAHDGIDSIPKEGTWLLDKGERVVDSRTNADLKQYLSENNQSANSATAGWTIIVNEAPPGTDVSIDEQNRIVEIAVAQAKNEIYDDFTRGGPLRRAIGR